MTRPIRKLFAQLEMRKSGIPFINTRDGFLAYIKCQQH